MKNLLMALFVATFPVTLQSANAQDDVGQRYLGISIGQTKAEAFECTKLGGDVTWTNCPDKDTGVKLYVGHNLTKNFAVEAGFVDFGKFKSNYIFAVTRRLGRRGREDVLSVKTSGNSLFVAGMGKIYVHPKVTLFGKVGLHRWDIAVRITELPRRGGGGFDLDDDDDGVDWFYGIGGEVAPFTNERIKLRAEYEMFTAQEHVFNTNTGWDFDFEFLSIGIIYAF